MFFIWYYIEEEPMIPNNTTKEDNELSLVDRMKFYEHKTDTEITGIIKPYKSFMIRLDGKNFSNKFVKPFDEVFSHTMLLTAKDLLLTHYRPSCVYVISDEIIAIFPAVCTREDYYSGKNNNTHNYDGCTNKIVSVLSGFVSTRFTYNLMKVLHRNINNFYNENNNYKKLFDSLNLNNELQDWTIDGPTFSFENKIIMFPEINKYEFLNSLIFRFKDSFQNFVSKIAEIKFSTNQLQNISTEKKVEMLIASKYDIFKLYDPHCIYGWLLKLDSAQIITEQGESKINFPVAKVLKLSFSEQLCNLLFTSHWIDIDVKYLESYDFGWSTDNFEKLKI
jgi:tRNA(His) 5'-end guanylyltransferase